MRVREDISTADAPLDARAPMGAIASVEAWRVRVPLRSPLRTALGNNVCSDAGIVRLTTDTGLVGVGEIASIWHGGGGRLGRDVTELVAPVLVGLPAAHRSEALARTRSVLEFGRHSLPAVAALDMALWDIAGQAAARPVVDLLGGPVRERVELSMSVSIADVDAAVAEASAYLEQGFRALKVKGNADARGVIETVQALRAELGDGWTMRVDLNMAFGSAKEALKLIHELEPFDVASVEQPIAADDLEGARFLTAQSPVPIMLDESVWTPRDALRAISLRACDLVNVYVAEAGGIAAAHEIALMCDSADVGTVLGSMPELATGTAASAHVAFAIPRLDQPCDVSGHLYHAGDVVHHSLEIENGWLLPPAAPGLGVSIDDERLDHFRVDD